MTKCKLCKRATSSPDHSCSRTIISISVSRADLAEIDAIATKRGASRSETLINGVLGWPADRIIPAARKRK